MACCHFPCLKGTSPFLDILVPQLHAQAAVSWKSPSPCGFPLAQLYLLHVITVCTESTEKRHTQTGIESIVLLFVPGFESQDFLLSWDCRYLGDTEWETFKIISNPNVCFLGQDPILMSTVREWSPCLKSTMRIESSGKKTRGFRLS